MKIDTQIQSQNTIQNKLKEHITNRINERMEKHIKNIKNKNRIKLNTSNTIKRENINKLMKYVPENQIEITADSNSIQDIYNITEFENFRNSSGYEEMWSIAIDKWTRNWNFYREHLTNSILEKFQLNNKRQKRQTKEDYVELTGQNINGSAIGPQDIFIEHYDCDAEEITNVKYYELNKISTCKFKPPDLDMTKTEVQLFSKAQAVENKAYAVAGTIKERVEWCSQHANYIRANRPSYYVSDEQRTKEMWNIAIDKWTRNWNFYREHLTNSIPEKFQLNNKRQKRQTKEDYVELTGQNINGSAIGPQDIFIEHYDCDAEEITNVKYYELNKISTCKFKPPDLDMTKTEVQLFSKAQAVENKAYAVAGTIKERVEWCSQHTNYIRANRPSYYVSDEQRTKILDPDEVRNELARLNLLKNTEYNPTRYNISFNYIANPPLQKRIEDLQGRIQLHLDTPMVPPYGRIVYDYTNPTWIPSAIKNAQSNCLTGVRKQNRIDILDWTLEIREVSLILNLDTEEISYMGTKLPCDLRK